MGLKERYFLFPRTITRIAANHGIGGAFRFLSDYNRLRKEIDARIHSVIRQYKIDHPGDAFQKYLDTDRWVLECLRRVFELGLHKEASRKDILDLGTGAGYFPYICNYYGHRAEALDVPDNEMYNQIIQKLGIARYTQYIRSMEDISVMKKYDLVTAFMICFNNHKTPRVWHIREWKYFLNSISRKNLKPEAKIFLSFNAESEEEPVSRSLIEFFSAQKASINGCRVLLIKENIQEEVPVSGSPVL